MMPTSFADLPRAQITLVGTIHRRTTAEDVLRLLEILRPDLITLELSPWAIHWRLSQGPRLLLRLDRILDRIAALDALERESLDGHPQVEGIRSLLAFPAEFRAAAAWSGARGTSLLPVDLSAISARKLRRVEEELVTFANVRTLVSLSPPQIEEGHAAARRLVEGDPGSELRGAFLSRRRGDEGIGVRDLWMARMIRRLLAERPGLHLLHIGGWVHLVDDDRGETLFSRLRELRPRRILP